MRRIAIALAVFALAACGSDATENSKPSTSVADGSGDAVAGEKITIEGAGALRWGSGDYGVVLAHGAAFDAASWAPQATAIAGDGATVIAVEDIAPTAIRAAVDELRSDGARDVALVGGSAGADAILQVASTAPTLPDQLILLSPNSTVDGLGSEPKLFIASEDEPVADVSTELAESSPGKNNEAKILPGSAHAQNIFDTDQGDDVLTLMRQRIREFA